MDPRDSRGGKGPPPVSDEGFPTMSNSLPCNGAEIPFGTIRIEADGRLLPDREAARILALQDGGGAPIASEGEMAPLVGALTQAAQAVREGACSWSSLVPMPDGLLLEVLVHGDPVQAGGPVYAVVQDVARRRQREEHVNRAQRVEALSELSGELAHEFNNVGTAILGLTDLLVLDAKDTPSRVLLGQVQTAARRGLNLAGQLLTFGRRHMHREESCDPSDVFQSVVELVRQTFPRSIEIGVDLRADPCQIESDPEQLRQAFVNLALNARDALADTPGVIVFRSSLVQMDEDHLQHFPGTAPGRYLLFEVGDTGRGIPKEIQPRIFRPFFTTREDSRSGLGLATTYGIIRSHGGQISFVSEAGVGTRFMVLLPYSPARPHEPASPAPAAHPRVPAPDTALLDRSANELVLFADDEESIRLFAGAALRRRGYRALTARNGQEAVDLVRTHGSEIKMVFLDLTMPVMGGHEAFEKMREMQPDLRVVIMSGYGADERSVSLLEQGALAFLAKPFDVHELLSMVEMALHDRPGA